ncbi:MAG: aconitase X catalytic domain-containing protein [Clostridiales Family XIII bacterium]|jgi:predicted aconitase|nr:aconitase X catalytic domain-containing protein [Clostridiales Family XIII bacterium]
MEFTQYEKEMLAGDHGEAKKFAMTVLSKLGTIYGADNMVEVVSAQIMAHYGSLHDAGLELMEKFVAMGGEYCIPTTEDPASVPFRCWREIGIDEGYYEKQVRLKTAVLKLGGQPTWTCTPYYAGNVPRFGQNVAWAESSAVSFANSVLGARTNRNPAGLNSCVAITGRMANFGLYKKENRYGKVLIKVKAKELSNLDYNTIGYITGKIVGNRIPVFRGIPNTVTNDNLKYLGAAAASGGAVSMYHVPGVTPEAINEDPFGGKRPEELFSIGREELNRATAELNTAVGEPDLVALGCPHYSLPEIRKVADLLRGKQIKKGKDLWIYTSEAFCNLAKEMGLADIIEQAGGRILEGNCLVISPMGKTKYRVIMTDSGKFAYYLPSEHELSIKYAETEDCIRAIVS